MESAKNSIFKACRPLLGVVGVLAGLALSACNPAGTMLLIGGSAISYFDNGKTIPDHVVSQMLNKDCSGERLINDGKLCAEEKTTTVASAPPEYCYRTLADVTCYSKPDPYDPKNDEVAWPNPNVFANADPQNSGPSVALRDPENKGN